MKVELVKNFDFEAAHQLPQTPGADPAPRWHGHLCRVSVTVEGEVDVECQRGQLVDYSDIQQVMQPLLDRYLHRSDLNRVEGLENPTSENICKWIWGRLQKRLPGLKRVSFCERCMGSYQYAGK